MDAGKLTERVNLLRLAADGTNYRWAEAGRLWAAAEQKEKTKVFAFGAAAPQSPPSFARR